VTFRRRRNSEASEERRGPRYFSSALATLLLRSHFTNYCLFAAWTCLGFIGYNSSLKRAFICFSDCCVVKVSAETVIWSEEEDFSGELKESPFPSFSQLKAIVTINARDAKKENRIPF